MTDPCDNPFLQERIGTTAVNIFYSDGIAMGTYFEIVSSSKLLVHLQELLSASLMLPDRSYIECAQIEKTRKN